MVVNYNWKLSEMIGAKVLSKISNLNIFCNFYRLQVSDPMSESIQIDATGAKPSKIHEDTNQETTLISLINVKSHLPILKFHPPRLFIS